MTTFPAFPAANPAQVRAEEGIFVELRVQTQLLCRIANLLAQMVGPANYTMSNGWTPEDLSGDLDNLRRDQNNAFN